MGSMAPRRRIIGGVASVVLHAGLLAWATGHELAREPPVAQPVEVERIELVTLPEQPLARRATTGSSRERDASSEPKRGDSAVRVPLAAPTPSDPLPASPPPERAKPEPHPRVPPPRPAPPRPAPPLPDAPAPPRSDDADATSPPSSAPLSDAVAAAAPSSLPAAREPTGIAGTPDGSAMTSSIGRTGTEGSGDYSAYGAELVRLVKTEIDTNPVPGLREQDSIEVVLEVLPSGRLAHRGLGKYDYAQVIRSSLGPLRMRAILRRILRASQRFPPHPASFPRQRYVLGFTVRFRDGHG